MSFTVPTAWDELTQEQLRDVLSLLWICGDYPGWENRVKVAAFLRFTGLEVVRKTDQGWLCRERRTRKVFLLDPDLLPALMKTVEWVCHTETINVRIERVDVYTPVDFELQEMMFGEYLEAEGFFQSYLQGRKEQSLVGLARRLYRIPEDCDVPELKEEVLLGAFLWFSAAKQILGREFPHFLKPAAGAPEPVTRESLIGSMRAQMRLLTKGDVTKEHDIRNNVDTWTAMAELDALAQEAEEIERKYGKKRR